MAKNNTSIQINGKQYNAATGVLLPTKSRSIDGVVGSSKPLSAVKPAAVTPKTAVTPVATPIKHLRPDVVRPARSQAPHAAAHHPSGAATLMRSAVSKPTNASLKRRGKVLASTHTAAHLTAASSVVVAPKLSLSTVNEHRAARASKTPLSPRIVRFGQPNIITPQAVDIPAMPNEVPAAVILHANTPAAQRTADMFERAIEQATGHEATPLPAGKKGGFVRRRMVHFAVGAVVLLAISVGIFGFHANQAVQFKLAANRAGFAATMPGYQPKGFSIADINVSAGQLNLRYASADSINGVGRSFALTEKPVDWTSQDLSAKLANSPTSANYATLQKAGRTIYIYGQNQAAWVSNGILYQVLGNGALNTQEFAQIASSM